jgi:dTMP kinase
MGKFIVFEGIDGSGKSTLTKNLFLLYHQKKIPIILFREPTSYATGIRLREFLQNKIQLDSKDELNLFIEDRKESVSKNIRPHLNNNYNILLDRYYYSTAAYQANEFRSPHSILTLNLKEDFPVPDFLFYLEIDPEVSLTRLQANRGELERFEKLDKLKSIQFNYDLVLPKSTIRLDATKSEQELVDEVIAILNF